MEIKREKEIKRKRKAEKEKERERMRERERERERKIWQNFFSRKKNLVRKIVAFRTSCRL